MFKNFHNSRRSSTNVGRWRTVFLALILALAIGSMGQTPMSQAAPTGANKIDFKLTIYPEKLPKVCLNTPLNLYAGVEKSLFKDIGGQPWELDRPAPNPQVTGLKVSGPGELKKQLQDIDGPPGSAIPFLFISDKPGKVTLKFTVFIQNKWIGANEVTIGSSVKREKVLSFTVKSCEYKATTIGEWHVPGPANISVLAISQDAEMKANEQGALTGSASVNLVVTTGWVGDCIPQSETALSHVDWTGNMNEDGLLAMEAVYQTGGLSLPVFCVGSDGGIAEGSMPVELTPEPIQVSMLSEGGVFRQAQILQGPEAMPGFVTIIIVPDEEEAAAFLPDHPKPGWDFFSSLLGALMAFH